MTITTLAKQISDNLTTINTDSNRRRIIFKSTAPKELIKWFRDIAGNAAGHDFNELDEVYTVLYLLCDIIADNSIEGETMSIDDFSDVIAEYDWHYDGNADLLDWVKENLGRATAVDEQIENDTNGGLFQAIQVAMDLTRSSYAYIFIEAMETYANEQA